MAELEALFFTFKQSLVRLLFDRFILNGLILHFLILSHELIEFIVQLLKNSFILYYGKVKLSRGMLMLQRLERLLYALVVD